MPENRHHGTLNRHRGTLKPRHHGHGGAGIIHAHRYCQGAMGPRPARLLTVSEASGGTHGRGSEEVDALPAVAR